MKNNYCIVVSTFKGTGLFAKRNNLIDIIKTQESGTARPIRWTNPVINERSINMAKGE